MCLIIHLFFYICLTDVKLLPEDDQDRSKHVSVLMDFVYNYF